MNKYNAFRNNLNYFKDGNLKQVKYEIYRSIGNRLYRVYSNKY